MRRASELPPLRHRADRQRRLLTIVAALPGSSSPLLKISLKSGEAVVVSFSGLCANRAGSACSVDGTGLNYDGSRLPGSEEALQLSWKLPMIAFPLHAVGASARGTSLIRQSLLGQA